MKLLPLLFSILGLGWLTSCKNSGYQTKNGSVYYKDNLISEADKATFEALNDVFAKDKNRAYYRGLSIDGANGANFTALDEHFGKDHVAVFYCDNYIDFKLFNTTRKDKIIQIPTTDVSSFVAIRNEYAKDKFRCYYKDAGFAVNDVTTFEPLDYGFGKDKQVGYFDFKPIPGSNGSSFVVLSRNFSKDQQAVYYSWTSLDTPSGTSASGIRVMNEADPNTFTPVGMYYAMDKDHAFYKNNVLEAAEPASFKQWDESTINYAFDSTHIYFQEKWIREADKGSFNLLSDEYAQDKKAVFHEGNLIKGADITSFTVLESGYAKDDKRVYYDGKVVNGVDLASFSLVHNEADRDASDKKHSYYTGRRFNPEKDPN